MFLLGKVADKHFIFLLLDQKKHRASSTEGKNQGSEFLLVRKPLFYK